MRTKTENAEATDYRVSYRVVPSPSLRVPVTPGNRALLRRLRAAELAAWQNAGNAMHVPRASTKQAPTSGL